MNQPQIKICEVFVDKILKEPSFNNKIVEMINSFEKVKHHKYLDYQYLEIQSRIISYNNDKIISLFNDLLHEIFDKINKKEIEDRFNVINEKIMPLFHPIFLKHKFYLIDTLKINGRGDLCIDTLSFNDSDILKDFVDYELKRREIMNKIIFDKDDSFVKKVNKIYNTYKDVIEINNQTKLLFNLYDFLSLYIHDLFRDIMNCNIDQSFLYERDFRLKTINRDILPLFHPMFEYIDFLTSVNLHGYFKINTISQWEIEREFKRYKGKDK